MLENNAINSLYPVVISNNSNGILNHLWSTFAMKT